MEDRDELQKLIIILSKNHANKLLVLSMKSFIRAFSRSSKMASANESRRDMYACGKNFKTLADIPTWAQNGSPRKDADPQPLFPVRTDLNEKVSLWRGDITQLEIDAIVNAANEHCTGGGGIDGAIHRAAGNGLYKECVKLNGCPRGQAKITGGHKLPARHVIHTVGPIFNNSRAEECDGILKSAYGRSLAVAMENGCRSVALCCISTGVYGFPNQPAAHIALKEVRSVLEEHADKFDRIIFCLFLEIDVSIYNRLLPLYFPHAQQ